MVIIIKKIKNGLHLNHRFLKEINYAEAESFIVLAKRPIKSVQIQIKILKWKWNFSKHDISQINYALKLE